MKTTYLFKEETTNGQKKLRIGTAQEFAKIAEQNRTLPIEERRYFIITKIRKAKPTDVFSIGNPFDGYKYIPRSSILYAETGDIVEEDPMVRKLREAGCFP